MHALVGVTDRVRRQDHIFHPQQRIIGGDRLLLK
ncbi:MAG: hypothetical protein GTO41_09245, partial [Burkholderiales bacterium]|nr:hypothetical protein [Burkholderiales bacterium]